VVLVPRPTTKRRNSSRLDADYSTATRLKAFLLSTLSRSAYKMGIEIHIFPHRNPTKMRIDTVQLGNGITGNETAARECEGMVIDSCGKLPA